MLAFPVVAFAKPGWIEDYEKGVEQAKKENKLALVDFTGSDWCSWCIKLDKEVFAQAKFKEYAAEKLILVEVDFPQLKPLPKAVQDKHDALAKKYNVEGFPTVVVLKPDGTELGKLGYEKGGAENFIAAIEKLQAGK